MRNYGEPMLDEPTVTLTYNKGSSQVEIAWSDPADISTYSPLPVEWAGTVVVRKEGKAPIHRWGTEHSEYGGEALVESTTRDEYSQTAFVDDTIEPNKRYYYAIMPYFVALDDAQHPIKHYRWTKVFSVDTARILVAPTLFPIQETSVEGVDVTVAYSIPVLEVGQYEVIKLVAKKDSIPLSIADGDKAIDLTPTPGMIVNTATMTGLDELSHYYFVIFIEDEQGNTASSEPQDITTDERKGWRCLTSIEVNGVVCPLLQISDFTIIPNEYGGEGTIIRKRNGIYIPTGVSDLGTEFAQPPIGEGTVDKNTNFADTILRTTFGYSQQAYSNYNNNEIIYNDNNILMHHLFLLATERNTRLYIGIALNDDEEYGCCYFVAQYPDRGWTTENYSGGDGEIGRLIYSIFGNS